MTYGSQAAAASQVFEQQRDLALRDRAAQQLELVDSALARLADGSFGTCVRCGGPIAPERLEALPWAAHCIELPERCRQGAAVIGQDLVGLPEIEAAAALLDGVVVRTPLVPYGSPDERVFLKAESLQAIGAFKIRGAYVAIAALSPEERSQGVITYSSGNRPGRRPGRPPAGHDCGGRHAGRRAGDQARSRGRRWRRRS